jgi:hypothetical protein
MIVFYQIRSHKHKSILLENEFCPLCQDKGQLKLYLTQKYTWFFVPILPLQKCGILECDCCKKTIPNQKWNDKLDAIYKKEIKQIKTPARMWRGMLVIPLCFAFAFVLISFLTNGKRHEIRKVENTNLSLQNIYENSILIVGLYDKIKNDNSIYTHSLMKVNRINNDSVFLNTYENSMTLENFEALNKKDINLDLFDNKELIVCLCQIKKNSILIKIGDKPSNKYGIITSIIEK